jgi:hypothetical protein
LMLVLLVLHLCTVHSLTVQLCVKSAIVSDEDGRTLGESDPYFEMVRFPVQRLGVVVVVHLQQHILSASPTVAIPTCSSLIRLSSIRRPQCPITTHPFGMGAVTAPVSKPLRGVASFFAAATRTPWATMRSVRLRRSRWTKIPLRVIAPRRCIRQVAL